MAGRYVHAKQFNRYRRELRLLRSRLGRIIRDIARKVVGSGLEKEFHEPLARARQIRLQEQRRRGFKFECIGKGKARSPYEFGVKAFDHYDQPPRPAAASTHRPCAHPTGMHAERAIWAPPGWGRPSYS